MGYGGEIPESRKSGRVEEERIDEGNRKGGEDEKAQFPRFTVSHSALL